MASALYENVGEWHTNVESTDILSSDETESSDFKGDAADRDDEYEEVSQKQNSLRVTPENTSLFKTETAKENGHDHHGIIGNAINGNGVHEIHRENPHNYNNRDDEGNLKDDLDEGQPLNGEENHNDRAAAETNEDDRAPPVPYYGRTLVAPEYLNFQLEETSQKEEKTTEDDNDNEIAVADESSDDLGSPRAEEDTPDQTVQTEVSEEDNITLSEEESDEDEDGKVEDEDQRVRADCQVEEQHEEEEQEEEEEDEEDLKKEERKEEENTAGENSKHTPEIYCIGSPQLAQAEDDEEEDEEGDDYNEVQEGSSLKVQREVEFEGQEAAQEDGQQGTQSWESSLQLAETDDDDQHDEEIDIETTNECNLKHSDSLKVQVASPTPDIGEVGSVAESFEDLDGEGVKPDHDDGDKLDREEQEFTIEDRSLNETDDQHEERKKTFNGPVQDFESQGNMHVVDEERDDDSCQSDDIEKDSNDETAAIVETKDKHTCHDEGGADLDTIPEGVDVEAEAEEYSVYISSQGQSDESDLAGRVKELGRMFEGGGPVFPKTVKNDTDAVDGSPVSVRRYKAIFEQDQLSAERAREPGRREELTGPPRGIVKNLRGLFENPQGFEARKG